MKVNAQSFWPDGLETVCGARQNQFPRNSPQERMKLSPARAQDLDTWKWVTGEARTQRLLAGKPDQ